jgi:fatty-acyl-CoA synthase
LEIQEAIAAGYDDPVARQAKAQPEKLAMRSLLTGEALSYHALDARIAEMAQRLAGLRGERIAVLGRNSVEQIVLGLAAQRAGVTFVPFNWRLTGLELKVLISDCAPAVLFHDDEFTVNARIGTEGSMTRLTLTGSVLEGSGQPKPAEADQPVILLYTSGTTGRPKGVIVTADNAVASVLNFAAVGEIDASTVALLDAPLFHTIGLIAVTRTTLTMGGTLLVSDRFLPGRTLERLSDPVLGVTHYFGVPQMAEAMKADPGFAVADLEHLHAIFLGGAPLNDALIAAYLDAGVALINGYGMSEAGTVMHVPVNATAVRGHPGSVGLPAPLIEVRLVGGNGAEVATGITGEVWLKGPSVTPGYWQAPEETAAAFGEGWFKTGDLAVREADGYFRIVDRLKDMYVTGGENVYPAEVEAALLAHPNVKDVAVIGVPDARWGETGLAFIVPSGAFDREALSTHCASRLARFKCPTAFEPITTIPRTASGKIMKHLLRDRAAGRAEK